MRFLTIMTPAGKAEYFSVALILNAILFFVAISIFKLDVLFSERTVSYAVGELPLMAFVFAAYAGLAIINCMRRIKQLSIGNSVAYLAPIPVVGQIVQIGLAIAEADNKSGYTPYGDNPYDPNSWVPPGQSSGKSSSPAVAFRGEALMLPGEDHWDEAA